MTDWFGVRKRALLAAVTIASVSIAAIVCIGALAPLAPAVVHAQTTAKTPAEWRTPWGHPDLQGIWTTDAEILVPFQRPTEFGDRPFLNAEELAKREENARKRAADDKNDRRAGSALGTPEHWFEIRSGASARTSFIVDPPNGRMPPLLPGARKIEPTLETGLMTGDSDAPLNGPVDTGLASRCITRGIPETWIPSIYNNGFEIVQTPEHVTIHFERYHETRVIPLDGRPHIGQQIRQLTGDSRGRWEGSSLVVDVTNFSDKARFRGAGEGLHLVERITRVDADTVNISVTVEDQTRWTRPWRFEVNGKRDPKYRIFEMACHEGNYTMSHILSAARSEERRRARAASRRR